MGIVGLDISAYLAGHGLGLDQATVMQGSGRHDAADRPVCSEEFAVDRVDPIPQGDVRKVYPDLDDMVAVASGLFQDQVDLVEHQVGLGLDASGYPAGLSVDGQLSGDKKHAVVLDAGRIMSIGRRDVGSVDDLHEPIVFKQI